MNEGFVQVWDRVVDANVSGEAFRLWCIVVRECWRSKVRREYLDQDALAAICRACRKSIQNWMRELEEKGLMRVDRGRSNNGKWCHYYPWWPEAPSLRVIDNPAKLHHANDRSHAERNDHSLPQANDHSHVVVDQPHIDPEPPVRPPGAPAGQDRPLTPVLQHGGTATPAKNRKEREEVQACVPWVGHACAECLQVLTEADNFVLHFPNGRRVAGIVRLGRTEYGHNDKGGRISEFVAKSAAHLACYEKRPQ